MDSFDILIRKKDSLFGKLFKRESTLNALKSKYVIESALHNKGEYVFGTNSECSYLYNYIKKYRIDSGNCHFDEKISHLLHDFFKFNELDKERLNELFTSRLPLNIIFNQSDHVLIANIPWELTKTQEFDLRTSEKSFITKTFSWLPFSRVLNDYGANLKIQSKEQLRILTCISDPDPDNPINGKLFHEEIQKIFERKKWLVKNKYCIGILGEKLENDLGYNYLPRFEEDLLSEIDLLKPHILIIISHGSTSESGPKILFRDSIKKESRWYPIQHIAEQLRKTNCCLSVILVACDLVFSEGVNPSGSGAISLLSCGIPSVIAIQSSILTSAGLSFIDNVVNHFIHRNEETIDDSLPSAVSFGRSSISHSLPDPRLQLDWSFPTLFFSKDGFQQISLVKDFFDSSIACIQALKRYSFTAAQNYLRRDSLEKIIKAKLINNSGLLSIYGVYGAGKSESMKTICLDIYNEIENSTSQFRPILYLSFSDEENNSFQDFHDFVISINQKINKITPYFSNDQNRDSGGLFNLIRIDTNSNALSQSSDIYSQVLVDWLEKEQRIFIFDNLSDIQINDLKPLFDTFCCLKNSLAIIVTDSPYMDKKTDEICFNCFDRNECEDFISLKFPLWGTKGTKEVMDKIFEFSGGNPLILNACSPDEILKDKISVSDYLSSLLVNKSNTLIAQIDKVPGDIKIAYLKFINYPKGISEEQMKLIGIEREQFSYLVKNDLLIDERKKSYTSNEVSISIYKMPQYLRILFQKNRVSEIEDSTDDQYEKIQEFLGFMDESSEEKIESVFVNNFLKEGQEDFLIDTIDSALKTDNYKDFPLFLLALGDRSLYENDKLELLFLLWKKCLFTIPENLIQPLHWLRLCKVSLLLGYSGVASLCLEKLAALPIETIEDKIDYNTYQAIYYKDVGATEKLEEMINLYDKAEYWAKQLIEQSLQKDIVNSKVKLALVYYNRAILLRWWKKDYLGSTDNMNKVIEITKGTYEWLYNLALSERVDMMIDLKDDRSDLNALKQDLDNSLTYFSRENKKEKVAWVYYRMARIERRIRQNNINQPDRRISLIKILDYYERCMKEASEGNCQQLLLIAKAHFVSLLIFMKINNLKSIRYDIYDDKSLSDMLEKTIVGLEKQETIWSKRVLRDLIWHKSEYLSHLSENKNLIGVYQYCYEVAVKVPLHPDKGVDKERAANIIHSMILFLEDIECYNEIEKLRIDCNTLLSSWFNQNSEKMSLYEVEKNLKLIAKKPDYYG